MKKLFTFFTAILFAVIMFAQSPQKLSYQAVIRDASNKLVVNHQVGMQISILKSSEVGTVVYTETQTPSTNANGLVSIEIGGGAGFSTIDWANGPYFIKTETDPAGGADYTITGTSQLLSVPYALHAKTAETITGGPDISGIATNTSAIKALQAEQITQNAAIALNTEKRGITTPQATILRNTSGSNSGDQDISGIATNATAIANEKARALAAEGANATAISDEVIRATAAEEANVTAISDEEARALVAEGVNATAIADEATTARAAEGANASDISAIQTEQTTQNAAIALNTAKTGITSAQATAITDNTTAIADETTRASIAEGNLTNAIADEATTARAAEGANASDISAIKTEQTTQNTAIALNTAKTGITPEQATAITANTTAIADETTRASIAEGNLTNAIADEATTARAAEGANASDITNLKSEQLTQNAAIALNTAKVGITPTQANAITTNTSDITNLKSEQTTQNAAIALNTAKVGITTTQASAIVANTAKIGVTPGTVAGQMQYWNGTAWVTVAPGTNGQILKYKNGVPTWSDGNINDLSIGDNYQGGIIAYFLVPGDPGFDAFTRHGLIAAPSDQSTYTKWGCAGTSIATGTALGTGNTNTNAIEAGCTTAGTAADICANLTLGGYDDWYLPSKDELNKLYINRAAIGSFTNFYYWSSSVSDVSQAWLHMFYDNIQSGIFKDSNNHVRAIRSF